MLKAMLLSNRQKKAADDIGGFYVPLRIRTPGLLVRSQTLYPAELMALTECIIA